MTDEHLSFAVVESRLVTMADGTEQLKVVVQMLLPIEANALGPRHEVMSRTDRHNTIKFEQLRAAAARAATSK